MLKNNKNNSFKNKLKKVIDSAAFRLTVMILILLSVFLIIIESFVNLSPEVAYWVSYANDLLLVIFIFELILRWFASPSSQYFFSNYWIDLLAVIPVFRIFRLGRVLRILRLLRLFRVFSIGSEFIRKFNFLSGILKSRMIEISIISSFALFAIFFGAVGLSQFEINVEDSGIITPEDAFWKSLFSLMAGEYADFPKTLGGKVVFLVLLIFEMGVFAMLTGTFSAIMVDKLKETTMHKHINPEDLNNHVIICGFGEKTIILVREFLLDPEFENSEILIISEKSGIMEDLKQHDVDTSRISIVNEDFTTMSALRKASVNKAKLAVITSERNGNRTTQDVDARTILAALTIEKLNPEIHTSAEIYNEEYASHLKMGGVEDVVIQGEVSGKLLARISMHEGLLTFFKDLLSPDAGNSLIFKIATPELAGKSFSEVADILRKKHGYTLVGVKPYDRDVIVNPRETVIAANDELLIIVPVSRGKK